MLDLLEMVVAGVDVLVSWPWRFVLCLALSIGVIAAVYWLIPDCNICLSISILVGLGGVVGGLIWQRRKGTTR